MKCYKLLILSTLTIFSTFSLFSQSIISVVPTSATVGQTIDIVVRGNGTHFQQGISFVDLGADIIASPSKVQVQNANLLTASIVISPNAVEGLRNVKVITKNELAIIQNGFEIYSTSGVFRTALEVLPVQSLSLGDIDPSNFSNSPFYFWVSIYNTNIQRSVKVELSLISEKMGQLGIAYIPSLNIAPSQVLRLDRNSFTKYKNSANATAFYKQVLATGSYPADNYTYSVTVTDLNTKEVVLDSNITNITNTKNNPELILPGAAFTETEQTIYQSQPLFQWFGQSNQYNFRLYMVQSGQTAEEAVRNIPVYKADKILANSFLYPNFAEKLIDGKEYAWQITSGVSTIKGNQILASEVFRFVYKNTSNLAVSTNTASIKVFPQQVNLSPSQQFHFSAQVLDVNSLPIANLPISWSVSPSGMAIVDANGNVTLLNKSGTFALIAKMGNLTDYATVNINALTNSTEWGKGGILNLLFGIPKK